MCIHVLMSSARWKIQLSKMLELGKINKLSFGISFSILVSSSSLFEWLLLRIAYRLKKFRMIRNIRSNLMEPYSWLANTPRKCIYSFKRWLSFHLAKVRNKHNIELSFYVEILNKVFTCPTAASCRFVQITVSFILNDAGIICIYIVERTFCYRTNIYRCCEIIVYDILMETNRYNFEIPLRFAGVSLIIWCNLNSLAWHLLRSTQNWWELYTFRNWSREVSELKIKLQTFRYI